MREQTQEKLEAAAVEAELGGGSLELATDIMEEVLRLHADQTPYLDGVLFSHGEDLEPGEVRVVE